MRVESLQPADVREAQVFAQDVGVLIEQAVDTHLVSGRLGSAHSAVWRSGPMRTAFTARLVRESLATAA